MPTRHFPTTLVLIQSPSRTLLYFLRLPDPIPPAQISALLIFPSLNLISHRDQIIDNRGTCIILSHAYRRERRTTSDFNLTAECEERQNVRRHDLLYAKTLCKAA